MKTIIRFYEGSNKYSEKELADKSIDNLTRLASGILNELNHQYNYRPTNEWLWAECIVTVDDKVIEQYRISRITKNQLRLLDVLEGMDEIKIPVYPDINLTFIAKS